ncbi:hypothetical protein JZ751_016943 [Albula glossodonta]|uniref:BTB domain-containing protein n=1 Tax=Albula glossodonta TaxID=121402 RepID=A0A8T2N2B3_9TELE|nr:hypothetical protein JZ751_016943 [Albula glossodonta]
MAETWFLNREAIRDLSTLGGLAFRAVKNSEEEQSRVNPIPMDYTVLNKLRLEGKLCDVVIEVEGTKFQAHKAILCACSPYFRTLFTDTCDSAGRQEYSILGVRPDVMRLFIEHIYEHTLTVTEDNVTPLLKAAKEFSFLGVAQACIDFLKAQLCPKNCIGIWNAAESQLCPDLRHCAFRFILHNFEEVGRSSAEFLDLSLTQLCDIIGDDELNVRQEDVVFDLLLRWIEHSPSEREPCISALLPQVRLAFLDPDYFLHNIMENPLVKENSECWPMVVNARRFLQTRLVTRVFSSSPHHCPRLPNSVLLAIGGWSDRSPTNTVESYDVRANCWVNVTQEQESPRAYHGAVYLKGFVYCIGGRNEVEFFSSVRRFDPLTLTWHEAAPMHLRRCYVSAVALDGWIYAMGGFDGHIGHSSAERYEPDTNQWSLIQPMHEHRSDASATTLDGKIYICGGFNGEECISTAECYSPQTDQWTMITPMGSRRSGLGVIAYGKEVYVVGGFDGITRLRSVGAYNPLTNSWRLVPSAPSTCSNFGIALLEDRLFTVGGLETFNTADCAQCYDRKTGQWSKVERMVFARGALSCCVVMGLPNTTQYAAPRDSKS